MTKFTWITDVHLDFLSEQEIDNFCRRIENERTDALLISGDIGQADSVVGYLERITAKISSPIYFVLGNHDYYRGAIGSVRRRVTELSQNNQNLNWLPVCGVVELTQDTALVGHDGWGDARLGDYDGSGVMLNDFGLISDLAGLDAGTRGKKLKQLGDEAAAQLQAVVAEALCHFKNIIVLTHVPPYKQACLYNGQIGSDEWLPHFTCKAVGDVLSQAMEHNPQRNMTIYCGHTHHAARIDILPNLSVVVGGAVYRHPTIQGSYSVA